MEQFQKIIRDLIVLFEEHLPLEQRKLEAIQQDDVSGVEECMKQEQALTLKLKGLDRKRESIQKELGWEGKPFREIVDAVPAENRQELRKLFDQLTNIVTIFSETNKEAMTAMEVHLRDMQKVMKIKSHEGAYDPDGNPAAADRTLTNRRV